MALIAEHMTMRFHSILFAALITNAVHSQLPKLLQAEYFWDTDPGQGGGLPLSASDGGLNTAFEQAMASGSTPSAGLHVLGVRAKGNDGVWGPLFSAVVDVLHVDQLRLQGFYLYWDDEPVIGSTTVEFDGPEYAFETVTSTFGKPETPGLHTLTVHALQADYQWGPPFRTVVQVDLSPPVSFTFDLRVALQGCMGTGNLMNNGLRNSGLVPLVEPYSALGYDLGSNAGVSTTNAVLNVTFPPGASVVDWILVEFRPLQAPDYLMASVPLLLRRGGTVSAVDGTYPFMMEIPAGSYRVTVRHRNHLAIASSSYAAIHTNGDVEVFNFTTSAAQAYGSDAQVLGGSLFCMWSGDVDRSGQIKYTGTGNDRDPILVGIGGTLPTNTVTGYRSEDVNMDGTVKYAGTNNDRDPILVNIGGSLPTNVRSAQLP